MAEKETRTSRRKSAGAKKSASSGRPEVPADATQGPGTRAPGLDDARHAASQRVARQADIMRETLFPSYLASAVGLDRLYESGAFKIYLDRVMQDAGDPKDPIERMMVEQLALAHFRIGQLQVDAARAESVNAVKIYTSVAARLLGEFRRTALALRVLQSGAPKGKSTDHVKLHKIAQ